MFFVLRNYFHYNSCHHCHHARRKQQKEEKRFILPHKLRRRYIYRSRRGSDIGHFGEIGFQD